MTISRSALICGVSGQDGSYLAEFLLNKGYNVWGTSRDLRATSFNNLNSLGIFDRINMLSMVPEDFQSVFTAIEISNADEIYFLAGQSSVGLSFERPAETIQGFVMGTLNFLEACRLFNRSIRFYQAGSSECFGDTKGMPATELTPFMPRSPYAVAKASAYWLVSNYREAYGLYACTGLLFNHESPFRPAKFVTQKIVQTAVRISNGSNERLTLGRLDISRDWGWAPEYIEAMWLMLQQERAEDFIIATGKSYLLQDFVNEAFMYCGLDWRQHVDQSPEFMRPTDIPTSSANPEKAEQQLRWKANFDMPKVVRQMVDSAIANSLLKL